MGSSPLSVDDFDVIFFISLASAHERRESISRQILTHGLRNAIIFDAIDGRKMDCSEARRTGIVTDSKKLQRPLSPGEIGCMLSHRNVWQKIVDSGFETAIVFEDDVILRADFRKYVESILQQIPPNWDMIYLHSHFSVGSGSGCDHGRRKLSPNVYSAFQEHGGTAAYAISQRHSAANYLVDISTPVSYAADGVTNWLSADWDGKSWASYIVHPFVVEPHAFSSSIWHANDSSPSSGLSGFLRKCWKKIRRRREK